MTSNITITGDSNLVAANIKKGVTILGVAGTVDSLKYKGGTIDSIQDQHYTFRIYDELSGAYQNNSLWWYQLPIGAIDFTPKYAITYKNSISSNYITYAPGSGIQSNGICDFYISIGTNKEWGYAKSTENSGMAGIFSLLKTSVKLPAISYGTSSVYRIIGV